MRIIGVLFTFLLFCYPLYSSELPQESELFFDSFLFADYHDQVKQFAKGASTPAETRFVTTILTYYPGPAEENRLFYYTMMDNLRALIKEKKSPFVDQFCVGLFESVEMWDSIVRMQHILYTPERYYPYPMTVRDLFIYTEEVYEGTLNNPIFDGCNKLSKETNDQMRFGNFPYTLYRLGKTLVIRIPSITREVKGKVEVAEEFTQYLTALRKRSKKHLYVNLITQKYGKTGKDPECRKQIEALEQSFWGTLFAVTLDKNSPFYFQEDEFTYMDDAEEFIKTFSSRLFATINPLYHWPRYLNQQKWRAHCQQLLHDIHAAYFDNRPELSNEERKDFIHIFYITAVKNLVEQLNPDSMNVSCVNTVDRGISLLSELYLDQIFQKSEIITREEADRFTALVLVHPIVLRNRPAHIYRLERIISATTRMHTKE